MLGSPSAAAGASGMQANPARTADGGSAGSTASAVGPAIRGRLPPTDYPVVRARRARARALPLTQRRANSAI